MIPFKLQSVLKLRQQVEDTQKRELGRLRQKEAELKQRQEQLWTKKEYMMRSYELALRDTIHVNELQVINHYVSALEVQIKGVNQEVNEIQEKIKQQQKMLQEAMKDRKIMENLKEIKLQEYYEEVKQKEQLLADELVSYKYSVVERSDVHEVEK